MQTNSPPNGRFRKSRVRRWESVLLESGHPSQFHFKITFAIFFQLGWPEAQLPPYMGPNAQLLLKWPSHIKCEASDDLLFINCVACKWSSHLSSCALPSPWRTWEPPSWNSQEVAEARMPKPVAIPPWTRATRYIPHPKLKIRDPC